jgi:hypothetical protein
VVKAILLVWRAARLRGSELNRLNLNLSSDLLSFLPAKAD